MLLCARMPAQLNLKKDQKTKVNASTWHPKKAKTSLKRGYSKLSAKFIAPKIIPKYAKYIALDTHYLGTTNDLIEAGIPERRIIIVEKSKKEFDRIVKIRRKYGRKFQIYNMELSKFLEKFRKFYSSKYFIGGGFLDFTSTLTGSKNAETNGSSPIGVIDRLSKLTIGSTRFSITTSLRARRRKRENKPKNHMRTLRRCLSDDVVVERIGNYETYPQAMCYQNITISTVL